MATERPDARLGDPVEIFENCRATLQGVAYRLLGSTADADDVVQDAWLRWNTVNHADVENPPGYLVRVTTRLAIDRLRRERPSRQTYVGPWLPEPVLDQGDAGDHAELASSLSMAMLVVLETLSPLERAVFVLREVFALPYREIAAILERSDQAVRQMARRARAHVDEGRPRYDVERAMSNRVTERFLRACRDGDMVELISLLAPDVELVADGGGLAPAPRRPIAGAEAVARFVLRISRRSGQDRHIAITDVNGAPGIVVTQGDKPIAVVGLDVADDQVRAIYIVANPEKLTAIQRVVLRAGGSAR